MPAVQEIIAVVYDNGTEQLITVWGQKSYVTHAVSISPYASIK